MEERLTLTLKVKPNAGQNKVLAFKDGFLHIAIKAPPAEGKANRVLIKFLAKTLKYTQKEIVLVKGEGSRVKKISLPNTEYLKNWLKNLSP